VGASGAVHVSHKMPPDRLTASSVEVTKPAVLMLPPITCKRSPQGGWGVQGYNEAFSSTSTGNLEGIK
jgi:hypothetical protein